MKKEVGVTGKCVLTDVTRDEENPAERDLASKDAVVSIFIIFQAFGMLFS